MSFFSESSHVAYQINGNENILPSYTPWNESKGQNIFFLKKFMLHSIKLKGNKGRTLCN